MAFLSMLQSGTENFECRSNPIPKQLYTYLSGSAVLANLTHPNKQYSKVKSKLKSCYHVSNS